MSRRAYDVMLFDLVTHFEARVARLTKDNLDTLRRGGFKSRDEAAYLHMCALLLLACEIGDDIGYNQTDMTLNLRSAYRDVQKTRKDLPRWIERKP